MTELTIDAIEIDEIDTEHHQCPMGNFDAMCDWCQQVHSYCDPTDICQGRWRYDMDAQKEVYVWAGNDLD